MVAKIQGPSECGADYESIAYELSGATWCTMTGSQAAGYSVPMPHSSGPCSAYRPVVATKQVDEDIPENVPLDGHSVHTPPCYPGP